MLSCAMLRNFKAWCPSCVPSTRLFPFLLCTGRWCWQREAGKALSVQRGQRRWRRGGRRQAREHLPHPEEWPPEVGRVQVGGSKFLCRMAIRCGAIFAIASFSFFFHLSCALQKGRSVGAEQHPRLPIRLCPRAAGGPQPGTLAGCGALPVARPQPGREVSSPSLREQT